VIGPLAVVTLALALLTDDRSSSVLPLSDTKKLPGKPMSEWCARHSAVDEDYGAMDEGLYWLFMSPEQRKWLIDQRLRSAVPWTPAYRWDPEFIEIEAEYDPEDEVWYDEDGGEHEEEPESYWDPLGLTFTAKSWPSFDPFPEVKTLTRGTVSTQTIAAAPPGKADAYRARSPSGRWTFVRRQLPRANSLKLFRVNPHDSRDTLEGTVMFDGPVDIPVILEGDRLWMSQTPFEVLSQIPVLDFVKGTVIVVGLGLGWQLVQVANDPKVTAVILVEKNQELVDWILPRLCPFLPKNKPIRVVVGDAHQVLRGLTADFALLDIWPSYTGVEDEVYELMATAPGIARWSAWGADWEPGEYVRNPSRLR